MIHTHKHNHCIHTDVKYCRDCNTVYCQSCNKEWSDYQFTLGNTTTYRSPYWSTLGTMTNNLTAKMADGLQAVNNSLNETLTKKSVHKHV